MIKHKLINHLQIFDKSLLKGINNQIPVNQITTNKIFDKNSTIKISYLNNCLYNQINTNKINHLQKVLISYIHFKGSKRAFNHKTYKSINSKRFWLVDRLKGFKMYTNKIFRLIYYKNKLDFKILLISSFDWSKMRLELYLTNLLKIAKVPRFWDKYESYFRLGFFTKD